MTDLVTLQNSLGVSFRDMATLQQSLVHRSYLNENPEFTLPSNERFQFLGDALLGFIVAEKICADFPNLTEGGLTKLRAALVREETLARLAEALHLGDYLYLGRGEEQSGGRHRQSNLACVFESLVAAILIDQGLTVARDFILNQLNDELNRVINEGLTEDYKSRLQELAQSKQKVTPIYRTVQVTESNHEKEFLVEVIIGDTVIGRGSGRSKRLAEKEAARVALESLSEVE